MARGRETSQGSAEIVYVRERGSELFLVMRMES